MKSFDKIYTEKHLGGIVLVRKRLIDENYDLMHKDGTLFTNIPLNLIKKYFIYVGRV